MNEEKVQQFQEIATVNTMADRMEASIQPESNYFEQEGMKFNKFLIENDEVLPQEVEHNFWAFMDREMSLSNLTEQDVGRGLLWFDISKIDDMMSKPDYKYTFENIKNVDQGRWKTFVKLKRSTGGSDRERAIIATQFRELRIPEKTKMGGNFVTRWFGGGRS